MQQSTSTVQVQRLRVAGHLGGIIVNTIIDANIGGTITGDIIMLPRDGGGTCQGEGSSCIADCDDGSGTGTPDGGVTINDLAHFTQGC